MNAVRLAIAVILATSLSHAAETIERFPIPTADELCRSAIELEDACTLNRALAGFWLGEDLAAANGDLREAYAGILGDAPTMTPELADENAKWQMRTWVRIYYLFGHPGARFAGRIDEENLRLVEDLLWNYAVAKSSVERADLEYVWFIQGSENHDAMDLVNAFLALQALKDHPDYANRALPDGHTAGEHVAAWTSYYRRYAETRVRRGLFIEIASPTYGKYLVPELVNIVDFAEDAALRAKMTTLLDVAWADWAIEQLDGVRGGAKTRCYQGNYSRNGASDSWRMMGQLLLDQGDWANAKHYNHPILGFGFILATSEYRLPKVVADIALDPDSRGEYAYISRRPGRMTAPDTLPSVGGHPCWYFMDSADSRLVRYTWCTPDHIMGSFRVDPKLVVSTRVEAGNREKAEGRYAAISGQNRWQGVVFATGPGARVFPQCVGHSKKEDSDLTVTEIQHVAVQYENVLIVQANRIDPRQTAMRIYFAPGMKERFVDEQGWLFLEEGDSYLAVKALSLEDGEEVAATTWDDDVFLRLSELYAPVVFVTGRRMHHATIDDFTSYVLAHEHAVKDKKLTYRFNDRSGTATELTVFTEWLRLPEINGEPIDLAPARVYDAPHLQSEFDSGRIRIGTTTGSLLVDID